MRNTFTLIGVMILSTPLLATEFLYETNDDGTNTITLTDVYSEGLMGTLTVPETYQGMRITRIGDGFMRENMMLKKVVLPSSIISIGEKAFADCVYLTTLVMNAGLQSIGGKAFSGCAIRILELPSTIEFVGEKAFTEMPLETIRIAVGGGGYVFVNGGVLYCGASKWDDHLVAVTSLMAVEDVKIVDGCTKIGANAFDHNDGVSSLRTITFPKTLKKIGHDAFTGCGLLTTADFSGTRLKELEKRDTFKNCTSLTTVVFPSTLKKICGHCFANCTSLEKVEFLGDAPEIEASDETDELLLDQVYVQKMSRSSWVHLDRVITYVMRSASGWDTQSDVWQGRPLRIVDDAPFSKPFGPYVPGERVLIGLPELIGYSARRLPAGLRLNKRTGDISGVPRRPTGDAGTVVTFTKRGSETVSAVFIVDPIPVVNVMLEGDVEKCKVTGGNKAYLAGKNVLVISRPSKGTWFAGWYSDGEPWPSEAEYQTARLRFTMPTEDISLTAKFEKEQIVIDADALDGISLCVGTTIDQGEVPVFAETKSGLMTFKTTGLPRGLKLSKNRSTGTWSVYGTPKTAGVYKVTITATAKSGTVQRKPVTVIVSKP